MIFRRLFRKEMSESDLLKIAGWRYANPAWPDFMRTALTAAKLSDGRTAVEQWRDEFKQLIAMVAAEKTWQLQKQRLISLRVASASWVALYNAVDKEPRTALWRSFVVGQGEFAVNPEERWPWLLVKNFCFAAMNDLVMGHICQNAYGTNKRLESILEVWKGLRLHAVSKSVALDRGINAINNADPEEGERLIAIRNGDVHMAASRNLYTFLREFADRIATDSVDNEEVIRRWDALCRRLNATLGALKDQAQF